MQAIRQVKLNKTPGVAETLDWALREMCGPEGGFYSALDADSEGVEGRFYVWTLAQLRAELGDDADAAIAWFGATEQGNFADPHHPEPARRPQPPPAPRAARRAVQRAGPDVFLAGGPRRRSVRSCCDAG